MQEWQCRFETEIILLDIRSVDAFGTAAQCEYTWCTHGHVSVCVCRSTCCEASELEREREPKIKFDLRHVALFGFTILHLALEN